MKLLLPVLVFLIILSCNQQDSPFFSVDCFEDSINYNPGYESIYRPCRQFIYRAQYWDANYNLISDQRIWMMATGKHWELDPGQAELYVQYEYNGSDVERIQSYNINQSITDWEWRKWETIGVTESQSGLWMHPFRANQYLFTEVAPFPMISYANLDIGIQWPRTMNVYDGWGDWANSQVESFYQITEVVNLDTGIGTVNDCYHVNSMANAPYGSSTFDYWFNMKYGIVKMLYRNYRGQLLQIELIEVVEG